MHLIGCDFSSSPTRRKPIVLAHGGLRGAAVVLDRLETLETLDAFYAGVVMDRCGLPRVMFTPTFASSRVIGWCANILEQAADNRVIRPSARYVGPPLS